jgi:predicted extracellular nuclease
VSRFFRTFCFVNLATGLALLVSGPAAADTGSGSVSLTTLGSAYTQNFDTLSNTAGSTTNTTLPTGWYLTETGGGARDNEQYAVDTGASTTGDTYSYGAAAATDRAFGALRSGTLIPLYGGRFTNNTGSTIGSLDIAYTGEEWRLGTAARTDQINFEISTNATDLSTGTYTGVAALNFVTPDTATTGAKDGNAAGDRTALSATISGLSIPGGATFAIRWTDTDATGADDGLSVDDFSITPQAPPATPALSINDVTQAEGNAGTTTFTFTVSLSSPAGAGGASFDIATQDNTATTADNDYQQKSLTGQTIPQGSSTYNFDVLVNGDTNAEPNETFFVNVTNVSGATVSDGQGLGTISNDDVTLTPIHTIQGAAHFSPLNAQSVTTTGIVTAIKSNGFWIQDPNPDSDDATSEGIFVFTSSTPPASVVVGNDVQVAGTVTEFRPGGAGSANLTTTEINSPTIVLMSTGNPLPAPIVLGTGGRIAPTTVIEDDSGPDVETSNAFDPANDGIDFYESLEGMRLQVNNPVAIAPSNSFSEQSVLPDDGAGASLRTSRGGILVRQNDFNPERIIFDDAVLAGSVPSGINVGDHFSGPAVGVLDYNFGNFMLELTTALTRVDSGLARETTATPTSAQVAIATFNMENLDPTDGTRFNDLASLVVNNLESPDIIGVEEIQDNTGSVDNGVVDASTTLGTLISAIQLAGGPTYQYREIDPVDDQDGGEPGGNIRVVFLFRTDRGLAFVDRPGGTSTGGTTVVNNAGSPELSFSPGRIDPTNAAFNSSRKPLAGEFTFNGKHFFVIVNHFNSKGGDNPLFGHFQPPVLSSEVQRNQQAQIVNDFVDSILAVDPNEPVIVLGDLNDYQFSNPLATLTGGVLTDLIETLPQSERYGYVFEGNSQALDHILASSYLTARSFSYDVVHVDSEFATQASDHDPEVLRFDPTSAPTAVVVRSFAASRSARGVVLRWRTASEVGVLGFNVYREQAGKRVRLNRSTIRALSPGGFAGHVYAWRDRSGRAGRYWLQVVRLDGHVAWHGPA